MSRSRDDRAGRRAVREAAHRPGGLRWVRRRAGLTLVELLVAMAITALLLSAAWPWCWQVADAASRGRRTVDRSTAFAFAQRQFTADVRRAAVVSSAGPGVDPGRGVTLTIPDQSSAVDDQVVYAYDAARGVVWRQSPSTYLIEHVSDCRITCYDAAGVEIAPTGSTELGDPAADLVACVEMAITFEAAGSTPAKLSCRVAVRAAAGG